MNAVIKENIVIGFVGSFIGVLVLMTLGIEDAVYLGLAFINCVICVCSLFSYRNEPFTTFKINHLFILFFFIFANAVQYAKGSVVSSLDVFLTPTEYRRFQFMLLLILIIYDTLYVHFHKNAHDIRVRSSGDGKVSTKVLVLISLLATIIVVFHFRNNPMRLFFRGIEGQWHTVEDETNVMFSLLFSKIIRPLPFACYLMARNHKANFGSRVVLILLMLVSLFPSALARNAVAMYWLPVVLLAIPLLKKPNIFIITMLAGLLVLFPFFDNFRYFDGSISSLSFDFNYLNTMNFDASQEFMIVMKFKLITYGKQLLGTLLFFVPRGIWPGKPIGSGATLAAQQDAFSNISMPFFAEGYINFGYVGIVLFTVVLAYISAYADKNYWKTKDRNVRSWFRPYYLIMVGAALYIMRGDLLSSFAYTFASMFDMWLVGKIAGRKKVFFRVSLF